MTIKLNLDAKYSALIDELTVLNQKLSEFVNGDENTVIQTDAGAIKSLMAMQVDKMVSVPTTPTSTGEVGQWAVNTTHFYVCVAANTWRRLPIFTW